MKAEFNKTETEQQQLLNACILFPHILLSKLATLSSPTQIAIKSPWRNRILSSS